MHVCAQACGALRRRIVQQWHADDLPILIHIGYVGLQVCLYVLLYELSLRWNMKLACRFGVGSSTVIFRVALAAFCKQVSGGPPVAAAVYGPPHRAAPYTPAFSLHVSRLIVDDLRMQCLIANA